MYWNLCFLRCINNTTKKNNRVPAFIENQNGVTTECKKLIPYRIYKYIFYIFIVRTKKDSLLKKFQGNSMYKQTPTWLKYMLAI